MRAVHHQDRADPRLVEQHFGLEQLELEAHRAQLVAQHEVDVAERQPVGRMARLRAVGRGGFGEARLLLGAVELVSGKVALVLVPVIVVVAHARRLGVAARSGKRGELRPARSRIVLAHFLMCRV